MGVRQVSHTSWYIISVHSMQCTLSCKNTYCHRPLTLEAMSDTCVRYMSYTGVKQGSDTSVSSDWGVSSDGHLHKVRGGSSWSPSTYCYPPQTQGGSPWSFHCCNGQRLLWLTGPYQRRNSRSWQLCSVSTAWCPKARMMLAHQSANLHTAIPHNILPSRALYASGALDDVKDGIPKDAKKIKEANGESP